LTAATFFMPIGAVVILAIHLTWPLPLIQPMNDRISRQSSKMALAEKLAETLPNYGTAPVFVPTYQWTALLRFNHIDAHQIDGFSRPSHFTQKPERPTDRDRVYVFAEGFLPDEYVHGFQPARIVAKYPLVVRGNEVTVFWLLEYIKSSGSVSNGEK
jgi:hypothetical protein